ncbi:MULTISPECIES: bifunctional tetrahydrofolate synthase/dihydrofolate synthase [unclassified Halomonas]|uniref:bifunctional tetrahydrofolate synthase/dihydrofolate synthase n=1 Tax=unclassified Halomonas TaxID=2609666 RepID=UPI00288876A9|nr:MULTISPECIES: bifunctional tetrahydrofolate synthase/dihydrofolate synthase [unclassified Halomonas]MDT0499454.1 bifunctional tetrahydrofolate synthase/dihydrofolate synthase [Halomonas sp. PAR7]MDT0510729.1 bifunctional tetrahydrofolate synthase/dihydrofolate synthase [Halomonas sp. LES1]MDT0591742.1 bifunctional tetrahydrofolate synthase/dihydrofolate synthase [Halomonas sp. PAR8]
MSEALPTTLDAWLARLEAAHPVGIDLGLERVAEVARRLHLLDGPLARRVITVAGTNGKGSTVAMLEALARAHGLTTATYTSPHLVRYNERLRLDGEEADDATLTAGFEAVEQARQAGGAISLTYFEVGTLGALWAISRRPPDLAILEVGLGGRLDAVNIIDPDVAVVTTVAQDHAAFLGTDLEQIGREKAGIMRTGRPAVLGSRTLPASVRETADRIGAPIHALGESFVREGEGDGWCWRGVPVGLPAGSDPGGSGSDPAAFLSDLPDPGLPLDNAATALQALGLADVPLEPGACRQALASVRLPGRMQWWGRWCLDVGHNPHAATYLARRLQARPCGGRTLVLLAMLGDKDADGVIAALAPVVDGWVPASLEGDRARSAYELAERLAAQGESVLHRALSPGEAVEWLSTRLGDEDRVLVCGSFLTVGEVLQRLASLEQSVQTDTDQSSREVAP